MTDLIHKPGGVAQVAGERRLTAAEFHHLGAEEFRAVNRACTDASTSIKDKRFS